MSERITVTLPDGSRREYEAGVTPADIAASIGPALADGAVAAWVGGELADLGRPVAADAPVAIVTGDTDEGRTVIRHSTAHVLAQAVLDLFPGAKYAIGPPIEDGFYYDFELPGGAHFSDDDLRRIEARMREIVDEDQPFVRDQVDRAAGLELFADQPYKAEIIEGVDGSEGAAEGSVSVYRNPRLGNGGGFVDLCRGPHVASTGVLGAFKLTHVAGAYWRGDEHQPMLQRIYGTAWDSPAALEDHLHRLEEAERRDHRRLGAELDLYSFPGDLGAGLVLWHPRGTTLRREIVAHAERLHAARGYEFVVTPHIAKSGLWERSGHLEQYRENMYPPMEVEGAEYFVKPMNCPFHVYIYASRTRSYRDLPMRLYELGTVYRYERSGVIHGILRPRGFTQDDAHIFCRDDQLVDELLAVMDLTFALYEPFGFSEPDIKLSTFPGKAIGTPEMWERATGALRSALEAAGRPYSVAEGEGAFYGPKIDFDYRDAIGRPWQLTTIQCDFALPERFDLQYSDADNERRRPVMIHRAILGSVERFVATLVEHYAGAFPTWLAPVQCLVLPVADRHDAYAGEVAGRLAGDGLRVEVRGATHDTLGARVRRGKLEKVPYALVVGDDDVGAGTVGVNARGSDEPERGVPLDEFLERVNAEVRDRR